jgi:hypothetical protein
MRFGLFGRDVHTPLTDLSPPLNVEDWGTGGLARLAETVQGEGVGA